MAIRFDRWIDSITLTLLEFGAGDIRVNGYVNAKTVPYAMVTQALTGKFEATIGQHEMTCRPGSVLLAPPGTPIRILHHLDPRLGEVRFRFAHLRFTLWGGVDVFSLIRSRRLFEGAEADEIGGLIQTLLDLDESRSPWEGFTRRHEIGFGLLRAVTAGATLLPSVDELLDGSATLIPLLRTLSERSDEAWTVDDMVAAARTSRASLNRQFRRLTGLSPMEYLRRLRLDAAAWRLMNTRSTVADVAAHVGYANPFHFSREFSRRFGAPPSIYRRDRIFDDITAERGPSD